MNKAELLQYTWIAVLYVYIIVVPVIVPQQWKMYAQISGIIMLFAMMFLQKIAVQYIYSRYQLIKTFIFPWNREEVLFVEDVSEAKGSNGYVITLKLATKIRHPKYGEVGKIAIISDRTYSEIFSFEPKKEAVDVAGVTIDHPAVAYAVLREIKGDVEHGEPMPKYVVETTSKYFAYAGTFGGEIDVELMERLKKRLGEKLYRELEAYIRNLQGKIEMLAREIGEKKQKLIRLEMENIGLRRELKGLLKSESDENKRSKELLLYYKEKYNTIIQAANQIDRSLLKRINWGAITTIVAIAIAGIVLYLHPEYVVLMYQNWWITLMILAAVGAIIYYARKPRR